MKKVMLFALIVAIACSGLFFNASASGGSESWYYSDASYSQLVGYRGYGICRGRWGEQAGYEITEICH